MLAADELRNGKLQGIAEMSRDGVSFGDAPPWFGSVERGTAVLAAVLRTPPRPLTFTELSPAALDVLVEHCATQDRELPGVLACSDGAEGFARRWSERTGSKVELHAALCLQRLERVNPLPKSSGSMRLAGPDDLELCREWRRRFAIDCHVPGAESAPAPESIPELDLGRQYLWQVQGEPVCMASWTRPTRTGVCISWVYTPEPQRGHGYASSLVARLSQERLDAGRAFCCLYTDLANPTSNGIYQRIGYEPVARFGQWVFDA